MFYQVQEFRTIYYMSDIGFSATAIRVDVTPDKERVVTFLRLRSNLEGLFVYEWNDDKDRVLRQTRADIWLAEQEGGEGGQKEG